MSPLTSIRRRRVWTSRARSGSVSRKSLRDVEHLLAERGIDAICQTAHCRPHISFNLATKLLRTSQGQMETLGMPRLC